ncbi:MAG: MarC family protein [Capnocytophaga sp.]|nr:MarC family protein [Capnocytophaga sp.]
MSFDFSNFDIEEIAKATTALFVVIDIIGSVPVILKLREKVGHIQSEKATIVAGILLIAFLFLGYDILRFIGVTVESFAVAGAFILFFLALEMILGISLYKDEEAESASIVPIAFPLIAGAGSLTTLLSIRSLYHVENVVIAILLNIIFVYIVLKNTGGIARILGKQGIGLLKKIFGVILLAIAVKLFGENVMGLFTKKDTDEAPAQTEMSIKDNQNGKYFFWTS